MRKGWRPGQPLKGAGSNKLDRPPQPPLSGHFQGLIPFLKFLPFMLLSPLGERLSEGVMQEIALGYPLT